METSLRTTLGTLAALTPLAILGFAIPTSVAATGAPVVTVAGKAVEGRPLRAGVRGGKVQAVRWQRCERRGCARPRLIGRDTGYRLTPAEARTYVRAQVRVRVRAGKRTVVRTVASRWLGPVTARTTPGATPTSPGTGAPSTPSPGTDPTRPVSLGTPVTVRGEGDARWVISVLGFTPDATEFVQMVDDGAPRAGSDERYVMARIRMTNATQSRQEASATGLRLALGTLTYTISAVAEPERLPTRSVDGGDAVEGTVYWRIPRTGTPTLIAALTGAPEWWRYFALG